MGALSIWHIVIIAAAALLLFGGGGKISGLMGDFGKGIRSFKKGLDQSDDEALPSDEAQQRVSPTVSASVPVTAES